MDSDRECAGMDAIDRFFLSHIDQLRGRDPALAQIRRKVITRNFKADEFVFFEGDPCLGIYYVQKGLVAIRKSSPDGRNTLIRICTPRDIIGYRPYAAGQPHRGSAKVLKPSVVLFIGSEAFRALQRVEPDWERAILRRSATAQGEAEERLHQIATMSLRARLAHLMIMLRDQFHRDGVEPDQSFELPISRTDLASMLGVRRESVSRAIHEMEEEGLAHFADRNVQILEPEALVSLYSYKAED